MTYEEYIASAIWAAKRLTALERDNNRCRLCNSTDELEVHHRSYGPALGQETLDDLTTLCSPCHEVVTSMLRERRYSVRTIIVNDVERIAPDMRVIADAISELEVPDYGRSAPAVPQWPIGRPFEPLHPRIEEGDRQAQKDGC